LGTGKIDFEQFVIGVQRLTNEQESDDFTGGGGGGGIKSNDSSMSNYSTFNEYDGMRSPHKQSSSSNSSNSSMTLDANLVKVSSKVDENNNNNSDADDSLLTYSKSNLEGEEDDLFGFGFDSLEVHRKSLINRSTSRDGTEFNSTNRRASELYNTSANDSKLISSFENNNNNHEDEDSRALTHTVDYDEQDYFETDDSKHYADLKEEHVIEKLEEKVNLLTYQNEALANEKNELTCSLVKVNSETTSLYDRIREYEEVNLEQERRLQFYTDEHARLADSLTKANASLHEETEAHISQKHSLEKSLNDYKSENLKLLKLINEINKTIEFNDKKLTEETLKSHELERSYLSLCKEKEVLKCESEQLITSHFDKIQSLSKALNETRVQLDFLNKKQRSNTIMDQMSSNTRIKELETEVDQVKSEKAAMSVKLEELNAEILKNNLENGKVLLSLSMDNTDSLAAEIGRSEASTATATTTSINNQDDNLLEKYALEVDKNQRLQDYIEDLVSTIMDHNPEILEINVSNKLKRTASVTKHK
jgi:hypothetical protein